MDVTATDLLDEDPPEDPVSSAEDAAPLSQPTETIQPTPPVPLIPFRSRRRRWLRRLAKTVAVLFVASTFLSTVYNAATDGRASVPAGLTYVQAGDVSTRYREWGASGTPIVLVHGFVESADTWQYLAPLLAAQGHRVYALDIDGWGYTQRVAPFDVGHQARQLEAFIEALHLDKPLLVGHSSGAAVAALATLDKPGDVSGIMFLDGDGLATGAGQKTPLTHLFLNPYRTTLMRLAIRSDTVVRAIYGATCGSGCPKLDAAGLDQWRRPLEVPGAEEALWSMVNLGVAGLPPARLAELATLPIPKSVVFGGADSSYDPGSPQSTAARIGAPAPTVIPGAQHLTSVNSPGAVAEAVAALAARAAG
ncbi:alpha/beta hydrolase [Catenulispora rubra]|uniref:alpha/beta hydrolase n=1 Tax=Catenulispora rubra TaxID=280293 RepID=UPI002B265406|nr:alpha/beta hydrolase [Catenulispora rubra]